MASRTTPAVRLPSVRLMGMTAVAMAVILAVGISSVIGRSQTIRPAGAQPQVPDFNGVWQALNEANYNLEPHPARAAMSLRHEPYPVTNNIPTPEVVAFGAVGSVPGGLGVVEGGSIPYRPEALLKKRDNQEHWLERDPEIRCYLPGLPRATYMPYPFQIVQSPTSLMFVYEYAGAVRSIHLTSAPVTWSIVSDTYAELSRQVQREHSGQVSSDLISTSPI